MPKHRGQQTSGIALTFQVRKGTKMSFDSETVVTGLFRQR